MKRKSIKFSSRLFHEIPYFSFPFIRRNVRRYLSRYTRDQGNMASGQRKVSIFRFRCRQVLLYFVLCTESFNGKQLLLELPDNRGERICHINRDLFMSVQQIGFKQSVTVKSLEAHLFLHVDAHHVTVKSTALCIWRLSPPPLRLFHKYSNLNK